MYKWSVVLEEIPIDNLSMKYASRRMKMLKFISAEASIIDDGDANDYG